MAYRCPICNAVQKDSGPCNLDCGVYVRPDIEEVEDEEHTDPELQGN